MKNPSNIQTGNNNKSDLMQADNLPSRPMRPQQRQEFIEKHLANNTAVDVLDRDFVESYIASTDARFSPVPFGAPKCPMLGRDLSALYRAGRLEQAPVGIPAGGGCFPTWVYSYSLPENALTTL